MAPDNGECRILVIGGTGRLGRHIVAASARLSHHTSALVRDTSPSDPTKAALLQSFRDLGVELVHGDLYDHASLVRPMKTTDVVISALGTSQIAGQTRLITAIKEAGCVKRFLPSEFWTDVDRTCAVEPARSAVYGAKAAIRRAVEASGVPHTYVLCGYLAGAALPSVGQVVSPTPPAGEAVVLGDGDTKVVYVAEEDVGVYTAMAAADPRAAGKMVYVKPPANTVSHNELLSMWEKKTGRGFRRAYVAEATVLKMIRGQSAHPGDVLKAALHFTAVKCGWGERFSSVAEAPFELGISLAHAAYILGETDFKIEPSRGVAAGELYPDVKYTTVSEYLDRLLMSTGSSERYLQGRKCLVTSVVAACCVFLCVYVWMLSGRLG
ncbi:hypothetical protein HU200_020991 [Digitaria exilis]|uniref:NmrA-like domain-containing protein n=1 Tax=Digitaria exilis TaxID=1010633 RepID=A0A835EZT0_9POAL|nr:hypothetical protein HU200_020991 [Digitaria exilis]